MGYTKKTTNKNIAQRHQENLDYINVLSNLYLAVVADTQDKTYMGRVFVHIPALGAPSKVPETPHERGMDGLRAVQLVTPFGGHTDPLQVSSAVEVYGEDLTSINGTVKSYGMWPQPPAPGTTVLVAYSASSEQGFLLGSLMSFDRNFMMGGRASGDAYEGGAIVPGQTGEKNPEDLSNPEVRPADPNPMKWMKEQGLYEDAARGHSASSARRETPSKVFGITTAEGHVLTMDDGDESGNSKNIRIRSKDGAQILIDDTNRFIFVNNHDGSSWIELDDEGNIDIYAKGKISMHTEDDFNLHAKGDINMQADKNINIKAIGPQGIRVETTVGDMDFLVASDWKTTAGGTTNIRSRHHIETADRIDMNGPQAANALAPFVNNLPANRNVTVSIANRVPEHHPWEGVNAKQTDWTKAKGDLK